LLTTTQELCGRGRKQLCRLPSACLLLLPANLTLDTSAAFCTTSGNALWVNCEVMRNHRSKTHMVKKGATAGRGKIAEIETFNLQELRRKSTEVRSHQALKQNHS